jgi:hypothetical protein
MKISASITFSIFLLLAVLHQPVTVFSETNNFDADGLAIDAGKYEKMISERDKTINMELENGYKEASDVWKDPIKLRQKRIEEWKRMRSQYNPDSLPHKIEK